MRDVGALDTIPVRLELVDDRLHVDRVPDHHRIGDEIQAGRLMHLLLGLFPADGALIGEKEEAAQGMEACRLFSCVLSGVGRLHSPDTAG